MLFEHLMQYSRYVFSNSTGITEQPPMHVSALVSLVKSRGTI